MTDERLQELLDDAARTWRVLPEPDVAGIWSRVEHAVFDGAGKRRRWMKAPGWRVLGLAMAASLVIGVALGRIVSRPASTTPLATTPDTARRVASAYDQAATDLLGRSAVLLTALPAEVRRGGANERFTSQASELLTTTRLLLDSPAASDRRFKELLEDLELVLAQVARMKPARGHEEMDLITDALEERDVVPRIRSEVARLSLGDG